MRRLHSPQKLLNFGQMECFGSNFRFRAKPFHSRWKSLRCYKHSPRSGFFWSHRFSDFEAREDTPFHCATNRLVHPNKRFYNPNDIRDQSLKFVFHPKERPIKAVSDYWKTPEWKFYQLVILLRSKLRWKVKVRAVFCKHLQWLAE